MFNGAVVAFVRAAALEIAPVRVNAVSPAVFIEGFDGPGEKFRRIRARTHAPSRPGVGPVHRRPDGSMHSTERSWGRDVAC
jgi:NAD(P)-dependent dehydrogenase (short-subunit alcohol dehydrogenase family)